jgi:diazepam-binding inhibitor (GABA receptor modulator, acyl-CoA-binding protein)
MPEDFQELKAQFEKAAADSKNLPERPDNDTLLKLYALYKQGTEGDIQGERPGTFDFIAGAKYDAWLKMKGTGREEAMRGYIFTVEGLKA